MYFQKNDVTYANYINLVEAKFPSNMQRITYSSFSTPCKNYWELLTWRVVFGVNRYACFMENKNIERFVAVNHKKDISLIKNSLTLIKKV